MLSSVLDGNIFAVASIKKSFWLTGASYLKQSLMLPAVLQPFKPIRVVPTKLTLRKADF